MKKALILGINGQDGSFLAEILLEKGYEVHGLIRRTSVDNLKNIQHLVDNEKVNLHYGDLADPISIHTAIVKTEPDEIYNEADQDHAGISFSIPAYNFDVTGSAVGRVLEIIRQINPKIKFFQPVTSNMFGKAEMSPQTETTPFNPQNPYSCAKIFALHICQMYRQVYDMHISVAILFNHESERRSEEYVTRKITSSVAKIAAGMLDKLYLGDMSARIDWGYAREYMEAAWRILQLDYPDTFVIGTGEAHSVEEFVSAAFNYVGIDDWTPYVESKASLVRPASNSILVADCEKAKKAFGFNPVVRFSELVNLMMEHDLKRFKPNVV